MAGLYKIGQIVELNDGRIATIRFVGETSFSTGEWIGVEFDDTSGKNDGSVQGQRYFDCRPGHGMFLRDTGVQAILEEPTPKPKLPATNGVAAQQKRKSMIGAGAVKPSAGATKSRPTSTISNGGNGFRKPTSIDPMAAKRQSINSASPTPGARTTRTGTSSPLKATTTRQTTSTNTTRGATSTAVSSSATNAAAARKVTNARATGARATAAPARTSGTSTTTTNLTRQSTTRASLAGSNHSSTAMQNKPAAKTASSQAARPPPNSRLSSRASLVTKPLLPTPDEQMKTRIIDSRDSLTSQEDQDDSDRSSKDNQNEQQTEDSEVEIEESREKMNGHAPTPKISTSRQASATKPTPRSTSTILSNKQIQELELKLESMEKRHAEDKEKLKTLERLQVERDRFEGIIQRLQAKYQPQQQELNEIRKQFKEKADRLDELERNQAEHDTVLEMATLDREMAEETADMLRSELDALKQRLEEVELEAEVLRDENDELGKEMSPEERTSQGWLQMERSNERLREALIRLRDMTQAQESELRDHVLSLEEDLKVLDGIKEQYDETKEKLKQSEAAIEDLRQQLDTALGAEDMIEELTEKNLGLAEQVSELQLNIEDLENLKELNDELELNHVETEKQMQDELDYKDAVLVEASRRSAQQEQQLVDHEYTINKFRELVTNLQSHIEDMRASQQFTEAEAEQLNARSRAITDLNVQLQNSAAKAQTKTVDLELGRLEAQEAAEHLIIVQMFLPEDYKSERDSVLAYLRFKRVGFKSRLLHGFLKDRLSGKDIMKAPETIFVTCDIMDKLMWVSALCDRFVNDISACSLEQFARYEGSLFELEPVERGLNSYIEAWKKNELREKVIADELQRSIALLTHLAEVHIQVSLASYADDILMRTTMMVSHVEHSANALMFVKMLLEQKGESEPKPELRNIQSSEIGTNEYEDEEDDDEKREKREQEEILSESEDHKTESLVSQYVQQLELLISQARSAKVVAGKSLHGLQELRDRSMSMDMETDSTFDQARSSTANLAAFCQQIGQQLRFKIDEHESSEENNEETSIVDLFQSALGNVRGTSFADPKEPNVLATLSTTVRSVAQQLSSLFALTNDLSRALEFTHSLPPWQLRSVALKESTVTSASAEEELKRLKDTLQERLTQLRLRDQTLEEQSVKIELLEARTKDANAKANRINELQIGLEESRTREKELASVIEKQFRDAHDLQAERDRWKQVADESKTLDSSSDEASDYGGGTAHGSKRRRKGERAVATAREMDALRLEIKDLQGAVRFLHLDNRKTMLERGSELSWLSKPLLPKEDAEEKERRRRLTRGGNDVFDALSEIVLGAKPIDLSTLPENKLAWRPMREKSSWIMARQLEEWAQWCDMRDAWLLKSHQYLDSKREKQNKSMR